MDEFLGGPARSPGPEEPDRSGTERRQEPLVFGCRSSKHAVLATVLCAAAAIPLPARPSSLTVPDDSPTIQAALDALVDTVLVRPGSYAESPVTRRAGWLMAAPGPGSDAPVLLGLTIQDGDFFLIHGLRVDGQVLLRSNCCPEIHFARCDLRGGVADVSAEVKTVSVLFDRCSLGGAALAVRQLVQLDSCEVTGPLRVSPGPGDGCYLVVRGCSFQGDGTGTAIGFGNGILTVLDNTIRDYSSGIGAGGEYSVHIANNLIEDCSSRGISVQDPPMITIENNVIRRCGAGIQVYSRAGLTVRRNIVAESVTNGVRVNGESVEVDGNSVFDSGGHGIWVVAAPGAPVAVTQNTSCFNGGSGFVWEGEPGQARQWSRNIGSSNGQHGVRWLTPEAGAAITCNDWFANQAGDVGGQPGSGADFSVDPMFCDPAGRDFRLNPASPLLDRPDCGRVGALGMGCGETATLLQRFIAGRVSDGVRVVWEVAAGATASEIWLERSDGVAESWIRPVTERSFEGRSVVEMDRSAVPGIACRYRLMAQEADGVVTLGPPLQVEAVERRGFRLAVAAPNPGAGPVRVEFRLAHPAAIELGVFDVHGRGVTSLARGTWPAGTHAVEWDGRTDDRKAAPSGVYLVRYRYPGGTETSRLVRLP